jgi:hypothetical protein
VGSTLKNRGEQKAGGNGSPEDSVGSEVVARTGGAGGMAWTERLPVHFDWLAAVA